MIPVFQRQDRILSTAFAMEHIPLSPQGGAPIFTPQVGGSTRGHFDSEHVTSPKGPSLPGVQL